MTSSFMLNSFRELKAEIRELASKIGVPMTDTGVNDMAEYLLNSGEDIDLEPFIRSAMEEIKNE